MNENIIVSINGLQVMEDTDDNIETITPGKYYLKNNKHYIVYEETDEETGEITKNIVKAFGKHVEVNKTGMINGRLSFEEGKTNQSIYSTVFGEILMEIKTQEVFIEESDTMLTASIKYELYVNNIKSSENNIIIKANNQK